jgi:glycosyltransferase involved in cell wall biosynthesis
MAPGGIGAVARGLARHLPAALPVGDRLTVLGLNDRSRGVGPAGLKLGSKGAIARLGYEQTAVARRARAADLVHLCDARPLLFSTTPFVITVHDVTFCEHPEWMPDGVARYKRAMLQAALLRRPRAVICNSWHTRERLLAHARLATRLNVVVTHFGVEAPPAAAEWKAEEAEPYFLTLSTIEPRKNHVTVLEAYRRLRRSGFQLRWKIAGSAGHLSEPISSALRAQDGVDVLEYVSRDERDRLLAGATFFVLPSLEEGFGLPVLEALARGVPTACSTGSALDEVAGDDAVRVPATDVMAWCDALMTLADDAGLRRRLSERGLVAASGFSWESTARRVVELYEELRD